MSLISTIKSILGLGERDRAEQGTTVTVERDADVTPESDVGTDDGPSSSDVGSTGETSTPDAESAAATDEVAESSDVEAPTESEDADGGAPDAADEGEPVDTITGIGPAYAERLADAGVHTVADLADADAAELAEAIDVSESRVEGWIEQASSD